MLPISASPLRSAFGLALWACGLGALTAQEAAVKVPVHLTKPGPWGQLEYFEICLEPPTRHVLESGYLQSTPEWSLPNQSADSIAEVFAGAGLTPSQIGILMQPERIRTADDRLLLTPPAELVQSLSPETRASLYERLAAWPGNRFISKAFSLGDETILSLAAASRHSLPTEVLEFSNSMIFTRGAENAFSDYPLALQRLPNEESRIEFTKVIMRVRSQMARLLLPPSTDLAELRDYWSIGGKNPLILPLLDAVTDEAGDDRIDIVHLLPPNARQLLFVYPSADMSVGREFPDCFWTAFNFLELEFSDRNLDKPLDTNLGTRWLEVQPPLRLGDIILISEMEGGEAVHACNYIADDLVYTKNGLSLMRPFTIAGLQSMLANYHRLGATKVSYYRHRDVVAGK